jgi:hypothetical protein
MKLQLSIGIAFLVMLAPMTTSLPLQGTISSPPSAIMFGSEEGADIQLLRATCGINPTCYMNIVEQMEWEFPEPFKTLIVSSRINSTNMICAFISDEDLTPLSFKKKFDRHCSDVQQSSMVIVFSDPLNINLNPKTITSHQTSTAPSNGSPFKIETNESFFEASSRSHNVIPTVPFDLN